MLSEGMILQNRYEIEKKVGIGGMAEVYKAQDKLLNRPVAIKVVKNELAQDEQVLNKFRSEAMAAASLNHHNIVGIYDFGKEGDTNFIVMEYASGMTLREYISRRGRLTNDEIIKITIKIAEALKFAHENNLIHRDIKSQNIMVTQKGEVKVTDFGIATALATGTISGEKEAVGSVHYLSPEQAKGQTVDARSDLYSLGITMYEMATGQVPFDGETPVAVAAKQINTPLPNPCASNDELLPGLGDIIEKLAEKKPEDRFQSADELIKELRRVYADESYRMGGNAGEMIVRKKTMTAAEIKSKKIRIAVIAALITIGVALLTLMLFKGFKNEVEKGSIPNVIGKTVEQAAQAAKEKGFALTEIETMYSSTVPAGKIIAQRPGVGEEANPGTTIEVTVSKGEAKLSTAGNYIGMTYEAALRDLISEGISYTVVVKEDEDGQTELGVIFDQTPSYGEPFFDEETGSDRPLTLFVSSGTESELVAVPSLLGETEEAAEDLASESNLKIGKVTGENHEEIEEGLIIAQSIAPNTLTYMDNTIDITISLGPGSDDVVTTKSGGTITIANPVYTSTPKQLMIVATDAAGVQTVVFDAKVTNASFGDTMTFSYPDGTVRIKLTLDNQELLVLAINS